jgi:hypothetical protein
MIIVINFVCVCVWIRSSYRINERLELISVSNGQNSLKRVSNGIRKKKYLMREDLLINYAFSLKIG